MNKVMYYGRDKLRNPYHYTECGLDDIYLLSGYEEHETPEGPGIAVKEVDALHRAIGQHLAMHKKVLSGKELRFLRKQMDLTQSEMGRLLGVSDQQVARYEKGADIPGSADSLLRALYLESIGNEVKLHELLHQLEEFDAPISERQEFAEEDGVWISKIAA